ncbi:hypothetical protein OG871_33955 [Kitasatospora sp. NBC_00374]|uniref:hypothetical protein n=1 Tax=Kitasatospora sp. NBC_00374 TaxID=2975964 RepID=UPI003248D38F
MASRAGAGLRGVTGAGGAAVLKHETGAPTTPEDDELLRIGVPGSSHVLVKPY